MDSPGWYVLAISFILRPCIDDPRTHFRLDKRILAGRFPPYTTEKHISVKNLVKVKLPPRPKSSDTDQTKKRRSSLWFVVAAVGILSGILIRNVKIPGLLKA